MNTNGKDMEQLNESQTNRHSKLTYSSFSMIQLTWSIMANAQGMFLFFYYHTVVGLDPWLILLATGINTFWAGLNDPMVGYYFDRNFKWTRRWGRRFPWMVISTLAWCFAFNLMFASPDGTTNPWGAFLWYLMIIALIEFLQTVLNVNLFALRVDKFRTEKERMIYSEYFSVFDMISMAAGFIVPPLLLGLGEGQEGFTMMAIAVTIISLIGAFLFFPGAREDKIIIDRYFTEDYERMNFIKGMWEVIKQKSFISFFIQFNCFGIATTILMAVMIYLTTFVLRVSADIMTVLFAVFLLGNLISVPFWIKMLKITNNPKKVYTIGSFALCIALIPLSFFVTIIDLTIYMGIAGFIMGCVWIISLPIIQANVIDEYVVRTGKNQKGLIVGAMAVLSIFILFIDELIMTIVFDITGFVAGYDTYEELAAVVTDMEPIIWGLRLLMGVIPMVILLIGTLVFWKFYPLTQEEVMRNKAKLKELGF